MKFKKHLRSNLIKMHTRTLVFIAVAFCFLSLSLLAALKIPTLRGPVMDDANLFNSSESQIIEEKIRSLQALAQIQVWTVPSMEGENIEGLSIRAVEAWKLGTAKEDNGILLLIAPSERQMRIEVGQGLEGILPDVLAGRIVDNILRPAFRQEQYGRGVLQSLEVIENLLGGQTPTSIGKPVQRKSDLFALLFPLIFIVVFGLFGGVFRRRFRSSGLPFPVIIPGSGSGWRSSGRGWGGGGWSGGGGGFSGGGASGNW